MFSITNIVVGFVGVLVGTFLGLGDAPFFRNAIVDLSTL